MYEAEKHRVLSKLANGMTISNAEKSKYRIGKYIVHIRFRREGNPLKQRYIFNINPNTLSAEYEIWICGSSAKYYLIPILFIQQIYNNHFGYSDGHNPGLKIVTVYAGIHEVQYAAGGTRKSLREYYLCALPTPPYS